MVYISSVDCLCVSSYIYVLHLSTFSISYKVYLAVKWSEHQHYFFSGFYASSAVVLVFSSL